MDILTWLLPPDSDHKSRSELSTSWSQILVPVVRFTAICEPGLVVTLTTFPDGTDVFIAQLRPVVKFWIVGVPGPTIVHSGQASALPPLIIVALPITALDAS